MGKTFKINCRKLYETGLYLDKQIEELKINIMEMKEISNDIKTIWNGKDYNNFNTNFTSYLDSINLIEEEILNKSKIMKDIAKKHNLVDTNLMDTMDKNRGIVE